VRRSPVPLRTLLTAGACLASACLPAPARATPTVSLHAAFAPETLGHSTTVSFRVQIAPTTELLPPPLTEAGIRYPAGLDISLSGLGIETCSAQTLELTGLQGCPPDSLMGEGRAIAEFPVKHEVFRETAQIAIVRGAEQEGHLAMLLYVYDETAVNAELILPSQLFGGVKPFGGRLEIQVPLVATLPEAPDLAVAEIQLVLGPKDLVYYERAHGKEVRYKPAGIRLPGRCPRGGFPFTVELGFLGGSHASGRTAVPCPARSGRRG
jgi:hypothetical protein